MMMAVSLNHGHAPTFMHAQTLHTFECVVECVAFSHFFCLLVCLHFICVFFSFSKRAFFLASYQLYHYTFILLIYQIHKIKTKYQKKIVNVCKCVNVWAV